MVSRGGLGGGRKGALGTKLKEGPPSQGRAGGPDEEGQTPGPRAVER